MHPMCGADLRRGTKLVAFGDAILSAGTIFAALILLDSFFSTALDPEISAYAIGAVILFVFLSAINIYLAFRLYRGANERNLEKLQRYRESALVVLALLSIMSVLIRHSSNHSDPLLRYPLLWFYTLCIIATVFRIYMYLVVKSFLEEFELL